MHCFNASSFSGFLFEFYKFTLDGKHELKVPQMSDKVCGEVQCMQFQLLKSKNKKRKKQDIEIYV
jgi:hypothetical protein